MGRKSIDNIIMEKIFDIDDGSNIYRRFNNRKTDI